VDTDVFSQQAGELIASAIQTARENQANQIEHNLSSNTKVYNIYRAQRDVIEYHNMCSLETALKQARASLQATSPDGGRTPPAAQGSQTPGGLTAPQVQEFRNLPGAKDVSISKASCRFQEGCSGDQARVPPCASVTAATGRRKDAVRRLSPIALGDPCPGPPLRSVCDTGRDEATVPLVEPSNWDWRSRAAGGWWARAVCGRAVLKWSSQGISAVRRSCELT
jgi:hypothetical protein